MSMSRTRFLFALAGLAMASLSGCALSSDEDVGVAQQRQVDSGNSVWRRYLFRQNSSTGLLFGVLFSMNQTAGSFSAGTEYWYINRSALDEIGATNVYISYADGTGTPTPPSFTNMQSFTLPVNPTGGWGSGWTTDPISTGNLYVNGSIALRMAKSGSGASTSLATVTWYQVLASGSPANIAPSGTFTYTTGGLEVPNGDLGYDISLSP